MHRPFLAGAESLELMAFWLHSLGWASMCVRKWSSSDEDDQDSSSLRENKNKEGRNEKIVRKKRKNKIPIFILSFSWADFFFSDYYLTRLFRLSVYVWSLNIYCFRTLPRPASEYVPSFSCYWLMTAYIEPLTDDDDYQYQKSSANQHHFHIFIENNDWIHFSILNKDTPERNSFPSFLRSHKLSFLQLVQLHIPSNRRRRRRALFGRKEMFVFSIFGIQKAPFSLSV